MKRKFYPREKNPRVGNIVYVLTYKNGQLAYAARRVVSVDAHILGKCIVTTFTQVGNGIFGNSQKDILGETCFLSPLDALKAVEERIAERKHLA